MTQLERANYGVHRFYELYNLEAFLWDGWENNLPDNVSVLYWFQDYLE